MDLDAAEFEFMKNGSGPTIFKVTKEKGQLFPYLKKVAVRISVLSLHSAEKRKRKLTKATFEFRILSYLIAFSDRFFSVFRIGISARTLSLLSLSLSVKRSLKWRRWLQTLPVNRGPECHRLRRRSTPPDQKGDDLTREDRRTIGLTKTERLTSRLSSDAGI